MHRYFSRILSENLRILLSDCFQINLDSPSLNQKVGKPPSLKLIYNRLKKGHTKAKKSVAKIMGKTAF